MKRIIFFMVFLLAGMAVHSQPFGNAVHGYKIIRLDYQNASGENGVTYFKYDRNDRLIRAFWTLIDKSRYSTNYFQYDSKDNIVFTFRDFSDGLTSFEAFTYDSAGNKISENFYRSDSTFGYTTYQYEGDKLIQARFNKYKGWVSGLLKFEYNCKNQKEKGLLFLNDTLMACEVVYEYDSVGNLVKEFWDFNGQWSQAFSYIYARKDLKKQYYSSPFLSCKSNYKISKETYTYNDELGGPSLYTYNDSGLLAEKVFIRSDSLITHSFYEYDSNGKLIASRKKFSDGKTVTYTYDYDKNDNLIRRDYYLADSLYGFESYLYNSDNDLMKAYLKNFDGWLSGEIWFQPDELGNVTNGEFKGQDGFDAFIIFNYNPQGLISEINWDFSYGKFQKYTFDYKPITSP